MKAQILKSVVILLLIGGSIECRCEEIDSTPSEAVRKNSWGQRQIEQMLEDRPDMQNILSKVHPMYIWAVDGFNGDRFGQRIHWIETAPDYGRYAFHLPPLYHYPPAIAIDPSANTSPLDKWSGLIFELNNVENAKGFASIDAQAEAGKLDAQEYANKMVELEFLAAIKTSQLLRANPLSVNPKDTDLIYTWMMGGIGTIDDYKKAFNKPGMTCATSNYEVFKSYYKTRFVSPRKQDSLWSRFLGSESGKDKGQN